MKDALEELEECKADAQRHAERRKDLEVQMQVLKEDLEFIPTVESSQWKQRVCEAKVRDAYRTEHPKDRVMQSRVLFDKQMCPWCRQKPKRRSDTDINPVCEHCDVQYHICMRDTGNYDSSIVALAKGKEEDCLGCKKPIV